MTRTVRKWMVNTITDYWQWMSTWRATVRDTNGGNSRMNIGWKDDAGTRRQYAHVEYWRLRWRWFIRSAYGTVNGTAFTAGCRHAPRFTLSYGFTPCLSLITYQSSEWIIAWRYYRLPRGIRRDGIYCRVTWLHDGVGSNDD